MYLKNLSHVPVNTETQALLQALREGRLFIQPSLAPACETRAEVLSIITRISAYAGNPSLVTEVWDAFLQDDRIGCFRSRSEIAPVNCYRICAIVRYMYEIGLYDMQKCKSANLPCSFAQLCRILFPGENADLFRRNCTNYSFCEDECLIDSLIRSYSEEGCRHE